MTRNNLNLKSNANQLTKNSSEGTSVKKPFRASMESLIMGHCPFSEPKFYEKPGEVVDFYRHVSPS